MGSGMTTRAMVTFWFVGAGLIIADIGPAADR